MTYVLDCSLYEPNSDDCRSCNNVWSMTMSTRLSRVARVVLHNLACIQYTARVPHYACAVVCNVCAYKVAVSYHLDRIAHREKTKNDI